MAKTSDQERQYHALRSKTLREFNKKHGTKHKTLRDAGLSLAVNGAPKPKALVEKAKPKRVRKSRAKDGPLGQKNGAPSEGAQ